MKIGPKKIKLVVIIVLCICFNGANNVYAVDIEKDVLELVLEWEQEANGKVAYLTFDDGPSIYTEQLLDILNVYEVPGIFFVLGDHFEFIPRLDSVLNRIIDEGHYIALHTMTHDKNVLYRSDQAPDTFIKEMYQLRDKVERITGHTTNLCRAPYGKRGHFKADHYQFVEEAGFYCVDWHVDSQDWAKENAEQIYDEVVRGLEAFKKADEVVLLFHEYQRTVEVLPSVIEYLIEAGYTFKPYVEGKMFEGLS